MEGFHQKLLIYVIIIIIALLITIFTFDTWQTIALVAFVLMSTSYLFILAIDKLTTLNCASVKEGFVTESAADSSKYEWLSNDDLFDEKEKMFKVNSEKDIFDLLGMEYITPDKR